MEQLQEMGVARHFEKVQEGVKTVMGGQILEYEAKTIWREGRDEGRNEGRNEERKKAMTETEERAKDMIRDRMELSLVEKYTHLPLSRIRELAHGLGLL